MAAVFLGTGNVGSCVVGLSVAFGSVGSALTSLSATVTAQVSVLESAALVISSQLGILANINASLGIQNDAILAAKASIRIPAVALPQVQVDASADINIGLTADLADPALYLQELLDGLVTVEASLEASIPVVQLTDTINANLSVGLDFQAQILAIDAQLELLVGINVAIGAIISATAAIQVAINAQLSAIAAIQAALTAAVSAVASALSVYASMGASLAAPGAYALLYSGPLSGLGAALDSVTPSTGVPGATNVLTPVMFVPQSDINAVNAVNNIYRTL